MTNNNHYSLADISKLMSDCRKYSSNTSNVGKHIFELDQKRELLNQLCTNDYDKFTLEVIENTFYLAKRQYMESKNSTFSRQQQQDLMDKIALVHDDMVELEESMKGTKNDEEQISD